VRLGESIDIISVSFFALLDLGFPRRRLDLGLARWWGDLTGKTHALTPIETVRGVSVGEAYSMSHSSLCSGTRPSLVPLANDTLRQPAETTRRSDLDGPWHRTFIAVCVAFFMARRNATPALELRRDFLGDELRRWSRPCVSSIC